MFYISCFTSFVLRYRSRSQLSSVFFLVKNDANAKPLPLHQPFRAVFLAFRPAPELECSCCYSDDWI